MANSKPKQRADDALTRERYKALKRDVQRLAERSDALNRENKVGTLWRAGRRIARERLAKKTGYHNAVLRDLARDTGIGLRNLQYAVVFHTAYPTLPKLPLSWGHYRLLLDRPTDESRAHYQQRAVDDGLTVPRLGRLIADDQRAQHQDATLLARPTDPVYLYAVTVDNIVDGDTVDLRIDLGFEVERKGRFRLAAIDCPELPSTAARAARDFVFNRLMPAKTVVVKTLRADLHGRYVAHVFYSEATLTIDRCFIEGTHLNLELLAARHAVHAV